MNDAVNAAQRDFWSTTPGRKWATHQAALDVLFAELRDLMIATAAPAAGERALDIGCGTGDTTLALADRVGVEGRVAGVDISEPLLALARERGAGRQGVRFELADAQVARFEPGHDLAASRNGVMFFADPVAAMANIASALRPGGRIALVCWAAQAANPWTDLTAAAGTRVVGPPPDEPPGRPGQFAFADRDLVCGFLEAAGFDAVRGVGHDVLLHVAGGAQAAAELATSIGPVARILQVHGGTEDDRRAIAAEVAKDFADFVRGDAVMVPARVNVFTARRP